MAKAAFQLKPNIILINALPRASRSAGSPWLQRVLELCNEFCFNSVNLSANEPHMQMRPDYSSNPWEVN